MDSIVSLLVRERRWLLGVFLAFVLAGALYMILRSPRWVSESRVKPQTNQSGSNRLAGLAAQLGIAVPFGSSDHIRQYAEMAEAHTLMRALLDAPMPRPGGTDSVALIDLLDVRGTGAERTRRGVEKLRKIVDVLPSDQIGSLRIRVTTPWPEVSERANRRVLDYLDDLSVKVRQRQATAERQFIEQRLDSGLTQLRAAEGALAEFMKTNRSIDNSPTLEALRGRLQREVDFRQQVYIALAQSYEQARLDEVRNTPILGILDPPEGTARNVNRGSDILIWPLLGVVLGVAFVLTRAAAAQWAETHPEEWSQIARTFSRRARTTSPSAVDGRRGVERV